MLRCVIKGRSKDDSTAGARVLQSSPRKTLSAVVLIPTRIFAMSPKRFHDFSSIDYSQESLFKALCPLTESSGNCIEAVSE